MTEIEMVKTLGGWQPFTPADTERLERYKTGEIARFTKVVKPRHPKFHRKYFALLGVFFESWEPTKGKKDFEQFREWVLVQIGHHEIIGFPDGSVRLRAKSISYAAMPDEDEFNRLVYSPTIDLALKFLTTYTRADLEQQVDRIMEFA